MYTVKSIILKEDWVYMSIEGSNFSFGIRIFNDKSYFTSNVIGDQNIVSKVIQKFIIDNELN